MQNIDPIWWYECIKFYFVIPKSIKFYTLFCYANSKQTRASTNHN